MRFSVRTKLLVLVNLAVVTILLLLMLSYWLGAKNRQEIENMRQRLVPRIEFALQFESQFAKLNRAFQDAAQAEDMDTLKQAEQIRADLIKLLDEAGAALDRRTESELRVGLEEHFETGMTVSTLLIQGKVGEGTSTAIATLQKRQRAIEETISRSTKIVRAELGQAFRQMHHDSLDASRVRTIIGMIGLCLVSVFGYWVTRRMLGGLSVVSEGLSRFSTGDFSRLISASSEDELGDLARDANSMAISLRTLAELRERADWIKSAQVELARDLTGTPSMNELATKVAATLMRRADALAAAVYLLDGEGALRLAGHSCCVPVHHAPGDPSYPARTIGVGEGLLGDAYRSDQLVIRTELPPNYFRIISGLGQGHATALALLPLRQGNERIGVIELALVDAPTERSKEFLNSMQDTLFVTFTAAKTRAAVDELLDETQTQAERLTQQEEELRLNNQELSSQQDALRRTNRELEEQQLALSERNHELDIARARVEEKMNELSRVSQYKSQFLANMSHELRTPLNSMLLLSHLLAQNEGKNLTDKQVQHCKTVHSAGQDLLELINQVLDLSKIEAGKQDVRFERVQLVSVAETMQRIFEPLAKEKQLDFHVNISPDASAFIATDRLRLERILTNLLGNAIKFTEKGSVTLDVCPTSPSSDQRGLDAGPWLAFQVSDTGIGIAKEQQERAFLPFEQIEASSSRRYQGSGLGLAIVRESVKLLGGDLSLVSEPGKGSTFTCTFPVRSDLDEGAQVEHGRVEFKRHVDADGGSTEPAGKGVPSSDSNGSVEKSKHILIIEDDVIFSEQLVALVRDRGLSALVARTGEDGIRLAKLHNPQGIILDVKLPDTDGWTVIDRIQSDPQTSGIPVHFLSALDAPIGGFTRGAVGYLTKPATRQELSELIRKFVTPNAAASQRIMVIEDSAAEGESIVALLESEHFNAVHVASAEAALEALSKEAFGCIILDLGLASMDGLAFLDALQKRPDLGPYGIVVHTGRSLTKEEVHLLQANAQAIVLKDGNSSARLLEEVRLFVHHVKDRSAASDVAQARPSGVNKALAGISVLLAEDDMRTVYSLSALLQGRGCDVLVAENGREALELLASHSQVRCVITDIMMPEMDGYEMMARIRRDGRWQGLPIVALTARAMVGERERCLAAGANAYLTKPVDGQKLISILSDLTVVQHGE